VVAFSILFSAEEEAGAIHRELVTSSEPSWEVRSVGAQEVSVLLEEFSLPQRLPKVEVVAARGWTCWDPFSPALEEEAVAQAICSEVFSEADSHRRRAAEVVSAGCLVGFSEARRQPPSLRAVERADFLDLFSEPLPVVGVAGTP